MRHVCILLLAAWPASLAWAQPQSLTLSVSQPCGPGSFCLTVGGAAQGAELFNLVSLDPFTPTGSGPLYGLSTQGFQSLLEQLLLPLSSPPFHVTATGAGTYQFAFCGPFLGICMPVDVVSLEWNPSSGVVARSPVRFADLHF